jgi:hypothetical protein
MMKTTSFSIHLSENSTCSGKYSSELLPVLKRYLWLKKHTLAHSMAISLLSGLMLISEPVHAALISTALIQVPFPTSNPGAPVGISRILTESTSSLSFSGTWNGTAAAAPWNGSGTGFIAIGSAPLSTNVGNSIYDFTNLTNNGGLLPIGTLFTIGDMDFAAGWGGGPGETLGLTAFDEIGNILTTPWLDNPVTAYGSNLVDAMHMPLYQWNPTTNSYFFDGNSIGTAGPATNPAVNFSMPSLFEISTLEVVKPNGNYSFSLQAPSAVSSVPIPTAFWLFCSGLIGLVGFARKNSV